MFLVKVNATSANVCVGFDVLGLALNIDNKFSFKKTSKFSFKGFEKQYCYPNSNLVYQAYKKVFDYLGKDLIPVEISFKGDIPVSRGLGSSSSLIVAGIMGANEILGRPLDNQKILNLACEIEGHPDNVAPAIYGGLVASYKAGDEYKSISYDVSKDLKFIVIIPNKKISTKEARNVLPKELPYSDIVNNLSRIINIPLAFKEGNVKLLKELFNDKLHEPYRGKLIDDYFNVKEALKDLECAFAISGSGSTMLVITKCEKEILKVLEPFGYELKVLSVGSNATVLRGDLDEWWLLCNS